jgi:hypothetical protein
MMRRIVMVGVVLAVLLVANSVPASAKAVAPGTWAAKFCTTLQSWNAKLDSDGAKADQALSGGVSNLKAARSELQSFLTKSVANTKHAVATLQAAGTPKVPNGSKISARFIDAYKSAQNLFASAATTAGSMSTSNLSKFEATAQKITASLQKGGNDVQSSFESVQSLDTGGALSGVFQSTPACAFLNGSNSATTTTG